MRCRGAAVTARPAATKPLISERLPLSIRTLRKAGLLRAPDQAHASAAGAKGRYSWGQVQGLEVTGGAASIVLGYRLMNYGGSVGTNQEDTVSIEWRPCRMGGHQPLFICPGVAWGCGQRVRTLYAGRPRFACRKCHELAYPVQRQTQMDRLLNRPQLILRKLQAPPNWSPFTSPVRPKGMHRKTYERLCRELAEACERNDRRILARVPG